MKPALRALRRRLNAQAYDLVNEEAARLDRENDQLRDALVRAEEAAEYWREQCQDLTEQAEHFGQCVGMTQAGRLVLAGAHA
ncbi:hypothetical protein M4R23_08980 [Acidovorax sp. GBBC 3332]|nr:MULTISPECIES: hypothetical protein [unclassified Acidovorax]MDA8449816.1 hypothetical protein [Acidovorax sp. GBBC 3297]MDA8459261.1 hypothetical protein [Acidovorax sp. GBBC 3333]MDA8464298.1 hypothetical protein [Acidovorax sp. GBBC 3332]MDA8469492.1 hypothetical protein [Acidovorax sp. GBBC 3299]